MRNSNYSKSYINLSSCCSSSDVSKFKWPTDEEQQLLKKLYKFEDEVLYSAVNYESHRICSYLEDLAAAFHKFYTFKRILGTEKKLAEARLALAVATKIVIKNGLEILGVNATEKM